jgi:chromate transporter
MICLELFLCFFQVGLFGVGGGYAAMPIIQNLAVLRYGWLSMQEFSDLITIAEMTPGPIAINAATFVGARMAGIPGALVATLGFLLPSFVIVSLLSYAYTKYKGAGPMRAIMESLRPAVVALIASAGVMLFLSAARAENGGANLVGIFLFGAAFFALRKWKISPILAMALAGAANLLFSLVTGAV